MTFRKAIAVVPARMQQHRNLFSVAGAFAFLVISPARADLVTNGGFETPITGNFTDLTAGSQPPGFGWSITSGGVDVVLAGPSSDFASAAFEGSQFLDLDGFTPGAIAQSFATIPGNNYLLSFAYANNPDGTGVPPPGCSGACATIPAQAIVSVLGFRHQRATDCSTSDYSWRLNDCKSRLDDVWRNCIHCSRDSDHAVLCLAGPKPE